MSISSLPSPCETARISLPLPVAPAFRHLPPPLIIIGMHRSGTSLAGGLLHELGAYLDPVMGVPNASAELALPDAAQRRSGYGEAVAFRLLNELVMRSAGALWNDPLPFLARHNAPIVAYPNLLRMELATYGSLSRNYLAPLPHGHKGAWGWKDPRNSLTLPYWLRLFPHARILHVRRDPEGVARSLMQRAVSAATKPPTPPSMANRLWNVARRPGMAWRVLSRRVHRASTPTPTAFDLSKREDCLRLTDVYVTECLCYRDHPGGYLELQYKHILTNPGEVIKTLADFAGIVPSPEQRQRAMQFVVQDSGRR